MIVSISDDVLDTLSDPVTRALVNEVLSLVVRGRHDLYLSLDDKLEAYDSPLLGAYEEILRKAIKHLYEEGPDPEPTCLVKIVPNGQVMSVAHALANQLGTTPQVHVPDNRASVRSGDKRVEIIALSLVDPFLTERLYIVVENSDSDGCFVWTCYKLATGLQDHDEDHCHFEFVLAGGSSTKSVLRRYKGRKRAICLIDGDFFAPGRTTPDKQKLHAGIVALCNQFGYDYHILQKRSIENYLPDSALKAWMQSKGCQWIEQHPYFTLPDGDKDFVVMKKKAAQPANSGYPNSASTAIASQQSPVNLGFGEDTWQAFPLVKSLTEFEPRDPTGEIPHVLKLIRTNL